MSLHFLFEAKFIIDTARRMYWFEDNEKTAMELLSSISNLTEEMKTKLISADANMAGWGICEDKSCHQCKGLMPIRYIDKPNQKYKKIIEKRKQWLEQNYFKSGQFHIQKTQILDYLVQKKLVETLEKLGVKR